MHVAFLLMQPDAMLHDSSSGITGQGRGRIGYHVLMKHTDASDTFEFETEGLVRPNPVTLSEACQQAPRIQPDLRSVLDALRYVKGYAMTCMATSILEWAQHTSDTTHSYWDEKVSNSMSATYFAVPVKVLAEQYKVPLPAAVRKRRDARKFVPTCNIDEDMKRRDEHKAQHQQFLDYTLQISRWRSRNVLQREYHDVFKADNPLLYEAFVTEQGVYTAEAVRHFMGSHKARSAVLLVGVAHQSAVEQHLCEAHGFAICAPTASQLITVAREQNPAASNVASTCAQSET
ncbi:hypothetical protein JKP88DRAFT_332281 [Tribonema minus]|uniref:Uncharacterized protein n=1 Tax=Tribonema minus TaxID=303371 RepID=A0A835YUJ3_9STRA|nr:hypothetical protein JKP88DRAFT_332281 [Tribonema minus]